LRSREGAEKAHCKPFRHVNRAVEKLHADGRYRHSSSDELW
jgi:hypothetical protein